MPYRHISQKKAQEYKRKLESIKQSYPGVCIDNTRLTSSETERATTALKLGFELILKPTGERDLFNIFAVKVL